MLVKKSPISGSGIARVHISVLDQVKMSEGKTAIINHGKKNVVVRLVADDIMEAGRISLRQKDLQKLKVKDGDEVELLSFKKAGFRIGKKLGLFRK